MVYKYALKSHNMRKKPPLEILIISKIMISEVSSENFVVKSIVLKFVGKFESKILQNPELSS